MKPAPFDIFLARFPWKGCQDPRPWLVVRVLTNGEMLCFPISGQRYNDPCFEIGEAHFRACGLTKPCYVHDTNYYKLEPHHLIKYRGKLEGDLLQAFMKYAGLKPS